ESPPVGPVHCTTPSHPPTPASPWPEIPHAQRKLLAADAAGSCSSVKTRGATLCQQVSECHPRISGLQAGLAAASTPDLAGSEALGCTSDVWSPPRSAVEGACMADTWLPSQRRWEGVLLRGPGGRLRLTSTAEGRGSCLVWGGGCGQPGSHCFSILPQLGLIGAHRPQVPELCSGSRVFCGQRGTDEEGPSNLGAHQACRPHIAANEAWTQTVAGAQSCLRAQAHFYPQRVSEAKLTSLSW
ncbi:hypothetical protein MC885_001736, partial [Smutsia gigantea]